jgi:hypothetical protein
MVPLALEGADITEVSAIAQRAAYCSNFQQQKKNTSGTTTLNGLLRPSLGTVC